MDRLLPCMAVKEQKQYCVGQVQNGSIKIWMEILEKESWRCSDNYADEFDGIGSRSSASDAYSNVY